MSPARIGAVARRHLIIVRRVPFRLFDILLWPVVDVILYGVASGRPACSEPDSSFRLDRDPENQMTTTPGHG